MSTLFTHVCGEGATATADPISTVKNQQAQIAYVKPAHDGLHSL